MVDDGHVLPGEHLVGSDRVLIVRIYGIGPFNNLADPLTMTSRAGLAYLPAIDGVIADMGSQFSSEIAIFGSMGSDPTTSFSVLSNSETLSVMLSRVSNYLRNSSNNAVVRTTFYVSPDPNPTIYCDDATNLAEDDIVRISGSTFVVEELTSAVSFTATRIWGSPNIPIAMQDQGTGQVVGAPIVLVRQAVTEYSRGGVEQLPVVISTAPISAESASEEEVIFRGMVSKVSTETSARGSNQIKVTCSSIMGMIRNTPFRPATMSVFFLSQHAYVPGADQIQRVNQVGASTLQANYRADISGPLWDYLEAAYNTRVGVVQLRRDKTGGVFKVTEVFDRGNGVDYTLGGSDILRGTDGENPAYLPIPLFFNDGVYALNLNKGLDIELGPGTGSGTPPHGSFLNAYNSDGNSILEWYAETSFVAENSQFAVIDLLFGTFNADTTGREGVRSAGMSAWLPFDWSTISDIVDLGELYEVLGDDITAALPILTSDYHPWPYNHANTKTVGDVLDWLFKRTGIYMVYDRGRLRFNRWTTPGVWPTEVDDAGLAEPSIALNFDRNNSIQTAEIDFAKSLKDKDIAREKYRVSNTDALLTASGKTVTLGNFVVPYWTGTEIANSQAMRDGVNLVTRYSKAAAIVEVTYRDAVYDLNVGEFIAFSSEFVPSALGTMGVVNATGFVLKAARSWKTPTTTYTLFLYGYLTATNRVSLISATGVVREVVTDNVVRLEDHAYTPPAGLARPGAPASDAAAFKQTLARFETGLPLQLLDEYGTPKGAISLLTDVNLDGPYLIFDDDYFKDARPGDVIVIAPATEVSAQSAEGLARMWDAFQADGSGAVVGETTLSYPWMV